MLLGSLLLYPGRSLKQRRQKQKTETSVCVAVVLGNVIGVSVNVTWGYGNFVVTFPHETWTRGRNTVP